MKYCHVCENEINIEDWSTEYVLIIKFEKDKAELDEKIRLCEKCCMGLDI